MVIYPLPAGLPTGGEAIPAWHAVERAQTQTAKEWWLIAQADHAALAGDLAACSDWAELPRTDAEILQAIRLHDQGWSVFDSRPKIEQGRPLSFLDVGAEEFLRAWEGSIDRAALSGPLAGVLVSEHFCRLGRHRLELRDDPPETCEMVAGFLEAESARQGRLTAQQSRSEEQIQLLVDLLQLFDLLSLYLCCGSRDNVEFPQRFAGQRIRLYREGELCRMQPAIFGSGTSLAVRACHYPERKSTTIPFLLG